MAGDSRWVRGGESRGTLFCLAQRSNLQDRPFQRLNTVSENLTELEEIADESNKIQRSMR